MGRKPGAGFIILSSLRAAQLFCLCGHPPVPIDEQRRRVLGKAYPPGTVRCRVGVGDAAAPPQGTTYSRLSYHYDGSYSWTAKIFDIILEIGF